MSNHSQVMSRTFTLRVALSCTLFLASICALARPKDKEPAPRFNATTTTGEKFTNQSIKGKVVLLEFWTTWCGFCADEAAFVDKIGHELADKGLILLAINVGESKKTVKKYLEQHRRNSARSRRGRSPPQTPRARRLRIRRRRRLRYRVARFGNQNEYFRRVA